jgi:hypothetical protein
MSTSNGQWLPSVDSDWNQYNPGRLAENLGTASGLGIYFDCGDRDELFFHPFNVEFSRKLTNLRIAHTWQSYNGGHSAQGDLAEVFIRESSSTVETIETRLEQSLQFVSNRLSSSYVSSVEDDEAAIPTKFQLGQNYPNPFNPTTSVPFRLPRATYVKLTILDAQGRRVEVLADGWFEAGHYERKWRAADQSSGIYFYRLETDHFDAVGKMVLLK